MAQFQILTPFLAVWRRMLSQRARTKVGLHLAIPWSGGNFRIALVSTLFPARERFGLLFENSSDGCHGDAKIVARKSDPRIKLALGGGCAR